MKKTVLLVALSFASSVSFAKTTYTPTGNPNLQCQSETKSADIVHTEDDTGAVPGSDATHYIANAELHLADLMNDCVNELNTALAVVQAFQFQKFQNCKAITDCSSIVKLPEYGSTPACTAKFTVYTDDNDIATVDVGAGTYDQPSGNSCVYFVNATTQEVDVFCSNNPQNLTGAVYSYSAEVSGTTECTQN